MPKISLKKKDKISEQILHYLFSVSPQAKFTSDISKEIARDEEFVKVLLKDLAAKNLLIYVSKNKDGYNYIKRQRWRLSPKVFEAYKNAQSKQSQLQNNNVYNSLDF